MAYWLLKSEPESFSLDDFRKEQVTVWYGVRNYAARNNLKTMQLGDECIFYRSVKKPAAIALAKVVREHYQDPTTEDTAWVAVDVELIEAFRTEVPLSTIKETPELQNMELLRLSRLSVQKVTDDEFALICKMGRAV
ncbi:MAG: EVE domain-containing protein [Saprospiraceae bacterium]|nr:EVE domain-containing protein [Saprospiraceae bacterium]